MWNLTLTSRLLWLVLVTFAVAAGGCAIPRGLWLKEMVKEEAPLIPGATRTSSVANPRVQITDPSVETVIQSPLPVAETRAWYEALFASHGWTLTTADTPAASRDVREYERSGAGAGIWHWETARLVVVPKESGQRSQVNVSIRGVYLWDIPSRALLPVYMLIGEREASLALAEMFCWL